MKIFKGFQFTHIFIALILLLISCSKNEETITQQDTKKTEIFGDKVFTDDFIEKLFAQYDGSLNFANNEGEKNFTENLPDWGNENIDLGTMSAVIGSIDNWYSDQAWAFKSESGEFIFLTGGKENGGLMSIALDASYVASGAYLSVGNGVHSAYFSYSMYGDSYSSHDHAVVHIDFTNQNTITGTFEFTAYNNEVFNVLPLEITNGLFTNLQFREFE